MRPTRGFTLVEIAIVLVIMGLLLALMLGMTRGMMEMQLRTATSTALTRSDNALTNFVMVTRRLPCPADGSMPPSDPAQGLEQRDLATGDCLNNQARGVVPWRTLGLSPADVTDGWSGLLMYRAAPGLSRSEGMNLTGCDPGGTKAAAGAAPYQSCAAGCTNGAPPNSVVETCTAVSLVVANRGFTVRGAGAALVADPTLNPPTGAAYVLLSHGANRSGGYMLSGASQEALGTVGGDEVPNASATPVGGSYVDRVDIDDTIGNSHFDDTMIRPTILEVARKSGLSARMHN